MSPCFCLLYYIMDKKRGFGKKYLRKKEGQHPLGEYWHMKKKIIYEKVSKLLFEFILSDKYEKSMSGF